MFPKLLNKTIINFYEIACNSPNFFKLAVGRYVIISIYGRSSHYDLITVCDSRTAGLFSPLHNPGCKQAFCFTSANIRHNWINQVFRFLSLTRCCFCMYRTEVRSLVHGANTCHPYSWQEGEFYSLLLPKKVRYLNLSILIYLSKVLNYSVGITT